MAKEYGARKQSGWKVVYLVPDFCKTPMGSAIPPVPYPVTAELDTSEGVAESVRLNDHPAIVYDASYTPKTIGDGRGSALGVKSSTVEANCWPLERSGTVRYEKRYVVRHGDKFWMNGRQTGKGTSRWTIADVLKVLCPKDKAVVDELAKTDVEVADGIYYDDPYYDGKQWTTKRFDGGGSWNGEKLLVLSQGSAEGAATTIYHELVHKGQSSGTWQAREEDAYYRTEQWSIDRGLPGQGAPGFRTLEGGKPVANRTAINEFVKEHYPLPKSTAEAAPVGRDEAGNTRLSDGSTRPPREGDTYAGDEQAQNKRKIPKSAWKCPGEKKPEEKRR